MLFYKKRRNTIGKDYGSLMKRYSANEITFIYSTIKKLPNRIKFAGKAILAVLHGGDGSTDFKIVIYIEKYYLLLLLIFLLACSGTKTRSSGTASEPPQG